MPDHRISIHSEKRSNEMRARLATVRVLLADRDYRTANLVQRILFSFGLRNIESTTNGETALALLRSHPFDFIITEWNMSPFDGITLVKTIRTAKDDLRIRRNIPIIMLTAQSELENVQIARDAGITEFVAKPFSAATISNRIVQIIDNPRAFVESSGYVGPCRRRRGAPPPGMVDRRGSGDKNALSGEKVTPPDYALREQLGIASAREIINPESIAVAQQALLESRGDYVDWARRDIETLKTAFAQLKIAPQDTSAQQTLLASAYAIQSQAGIFDYVLGTKIAKQLSEYVSNHLPPNNNHLLVIEKYIEAVQVTFNYNIELHGQSIAKDLIESLEQLVAKLDH